MTRNVYPVVLKQGIKFIVVDIPDFQIDTQGKDVAEAIEMARDAIGLMGMDMQDDGEELPTPSRLEDIRKENIKDIVTLVDVDFDEYRRAHEMRAVKKNCTIPSWLNFEAEKAGINFSNLLAEAIRKKLGIAGKPRNGTCKSIDLRR